jgi:hypothetical protein
MTAHELTAEQKDAVRLFATGASLAIEAGAGTGKTSTLIAIAESTTRRGQYVAFNRSIVDDAKAKMPSNVNASTAHSLAFRAVGKKYSHRLPTVRMRGDEIARRLRIDPLTIKVGDDNRRLSPGYLAGLVIKATKNFTHSADQVISVDHIPYIDGIDLPVGERRGWANNREVRRFLAPALAAAWVDLASTTGILPFTHDCYLKIFELSGPVIPVDFILFDECQPPSTLVALAGGGARRIADLKVGDRVVSYTKGRVMSEKFGSVVLGKSTRQHDGELVVVTTDEETSSYTPNHICMARIGAAFESNFSLYLMRKDDRWRVGVAKARHGTGVGRQMGVTGRLREEAGDALWVLGNFQTRAEAEIEEERSSLIWRLPQARFSAWKFWARWDQAFSDPGGCAHHYGRDLRYPLVSGERRYMLGDRFTEVRAANLLDGMEVMHRDMTLHSITVGRTPYSGPVVSLTVSGPATYIGNGIVTHNCQDADPVMLSIVQQQKCQLVFVGDSCQPPGTMVQAIIGRGPGRGRPPLIEERPIEQVRQGDRVVSYDIAGSHLHKTGSLVSAVTARQVSERLVSVKAGEFATRYTTDHHAIIRVGPAFERKHVVYMMRRGEQYRIGRAQGRYGAGFGPVLRAQAEGADALWLLSAHDSVDEAALAEALTAQRFGIPTWTFERTATHRMDVDAFWLRIGANTDRAAACLHGSGRDIRFPLWEPAIGNLLIRRAFVTRAANLMDGMQVLPAMEATRHGARIWRSIAVTREEYVGLVHSLTVEGDHTYIADGVITHNCQQIYDWRGAVNALAELGGSRCFLTNSFRFGPPIADIANSILSRIPDAELRLTGRAPYESTFGACTAPKAYLTRTNAGAIDYALKETSLGRKVHLMGGGKEIASFCRAALDLQADPPRRTEHPELACFASWREVEDYADLDPNGDELRLMVKIINQYGALTILDLVDGTVTEDKADVVVSTAHKAKGREWDVVRLGSDFSAPKEGGAPSASELRLLYVAATRARRHLDGSICGALIYLLAEVDEEPEQDELDAGLVPEPVRVTDPICMTCKAPLARENRPGEECPICRTVAS